MYEPLDMGRTHVCMDPLTCLDIKQYTLEQGSYSLQTTDHCWCLSYSAGAGGPSSSALRRDAAAVSNRWAGRFAAAGPVAEASPVAELLPKSEERD
jgi:hypothetical protein